ncbi:E3 ubiquitin-protein ligase RNF217 isoform X2 [Salminus brasiliensis]|uniref:E3 ubiquitin-protein ligase RNF217 isoform X2 n=1 Tax=Salminus brasiliensis TaxID=930266 RepID=UPI003B831DB3
MPVFLGYDGEPVSSLSELSGEVGTRSRDFVQEETKAKAEFTEESLDERGGSKDSEEKEIIRKTSVVDILRRNVGAPKPSFASVANDNNNVEPPKDSESVSAASPGLERGSLVRNEGEESDSRSWDFSTSLRCEDCELSDSEGTAESGSYTGGDSLNQDLGGRLDPYTLSDLADSTVLNSVSSSVSVVLTCRICLDDRHTRPLHCCQKAVCEECLKTYISSQVLVGRTDIVCPITECSGYLEESMVVAHLASEELAKYKYFLELSRLDSSTKPCPQCSLFTSLKGRGLQAPSKAEHKYKIQCSKCQFVWCFKCHAPWHEGLKCREYRKGDKLLRHWASVIEHGQRNAQKCPRCKIHIQRTEGCDHMTCTQCNTNFCYRCGEKYRHLRFFGDHTSNLSVFGCKYRYLPDKPHLRRLVRGSVCVSKVLMAPVVIVLVVVVGALALVIGLFAFPIYYICKKRRKHSNGSGRWLC